ncbi:carbon-nitrogen family hydrolase [Salinicoccus albus]|uniref:carbon-nitrogen family hydrolase n=1 Tax=Salinicoccus albus TaxID=418756 RepID=UPI000382B96E|nr:carbon-nitrogen family hydrolase [Salinicoccus albus]
MNIKGFQFKVQFGDVEANIAKVKALFAKNDLQDTDVVVLPEMWTTGYDLKNIETHACRNLEPAQSVISELAVKYDVNIVAGSVANSKDDKHKVCNTAFVVNRSGTLVYEYSKIHLVPMLNEPKYLTGGTEKTETFELDGETCGVVICYDLRFPELFRDLALKGAETIFVVAEWPLPRQKHWETLLAARAIENQCYIIGVDTYGEIEADTFAGRSVIIGPFGELVDEADTHSETVITGTSDGDEVKRIRKDVPIFDSRKRDMYHFL